MKKIEEFFGRYEEAANTFDPRLVSSQFTADFMSGDPNGVICIRNDEEFLKAIPERGAFFEKIGFKYAKILDISESALDDRYTMAKVHWHMAFEKDPGKQLDFRFYITYILVDLGDGPKVAFYVSHDDELKVMRDAGLIPEKTPNQGG
jgi:hypothetical protein